MDASAVFLSVVVLVFAVASAVLGFIAQSKTLTPDEIKYTGGVCVYPAKPAYMLGIRAAALLATAEIIVSVASLCSGCFHLLRGGATDPKLKTAASCIVLSWVFAAVAAVYYQEGVSWNAATTRPRVVDGLFIKCRYLRDAAFRRAAVFGLVAAVLGICAYAIFHERPGEEPKPDGQQPAVGGTQSAQQQVSPLPPQVASAV